MVIQNYFFKNPNKAFSFQQVLVSKLSMTATDLSDVHYVSPRRPNSIGMPFTEHVNGLSITQQLHLNFPSL